VPVRGALTGLRFVDSRTDPRVQVADFVAGVARKAASEVLDDRGDAGLTALLGPYPDPFSIWGADAGPAGPGGHRAVTPAPRPAFG
jgi:hypothetical protein